MTRTETDAATQARRLKLLGVAHKGAKLLGMDDDTRRMTQLRVTGYASCADMPVGALVKWCWHLKNNGANIGIPAASPVNAGATAAQWTELEKLVLAFGWDGFDDPRLMRFVKHTAKVDALRFLSRAKMSAVISGLTRWGATRTAA